MPQNKPINTHLLNILIRKRFNTVAAFSRESGIPVNRLYNWVNGVCAPPPDTLKEMAKHLGISAQMFYVPGIRFVRMGIESAMVRWSLEQHEMEAPTLTSNEALQFIRFAEPDFVEETEDETKEEAFAVQGSEELSDTTE